MKVFDVVVKMKLMIFEVIFCSKESRLLKKTVEAASN